MTERKPLVLVDGNVVELPAGDYIDNGNIVERQNNSGNAMPGGTPVIASSGTGVNMADASQATKLNVMGLAMEDLAVDALGKFQCDGIVKLTAGQWDVVTGDSGGLDANLVYYLDTTTGKLTSTAPTSGWVVRVGLAISATELRLGISAPIAIA